MTERVQLLRKFFIEEQKHREHRSSPVDPFMLAASFREQQLPDTSRAVKRLVYMLNAETPLLIPGQTILSCAPIPLCRPFIQRRKKKPWLLHTDCMSWGSCPTSVWTIPVSFVQAFPVCGGRCWQGKKSSCLNRKRTRRTIWTA